MTNLEALGTPPQAASLRGGDKPVVRAQEPDGERPVDKGERTAPVRRIEAPARSFQARLNYDSAAEEVFVEILNPQTGDVLTRLPAEELPNDIRALVSASGPLIETVA